MIKPRSQPSHFKLQAKTQPWNFEGNFSSHSSDSFNPMNVESMVPVTPMGSVTPPATRDRGSKVGNQPMLKSTVDVSFSLCRICSVLLGLLSFVLNVQTCEHGTMWKIPHL